MLRRCLIFLRRRFNSGRREYYLLFAAASTVLALITVAVDIFLPFEGYANILRSLLLAPTAAAVFALAYGVGLKLHYARLEADPAWTPYRARFSPAWRRRIAVVVGAVIIVIVQAMTETVGYTLSSSVLGALVIATVAFVRRSKAEIQREELGIPDARDIMYDAEKRQIEREQQLRAEAKKQRKQKRGAKDKNSVD